jgi:hypothetical protein
MKSNLPDKETHKTIRVTATYESFYAYYINLPIQAHPHRIYDFVRSGTVDIAMSMTEDPFGSWNWEVPEEQMLFNPHAEDLSDAFLASQSKTKETT